MDTKLKKFSYGLLWLLLIVSTVAAGINFSLFTSAIQIQIYNLDPDYHFGYHDDNGNWVAYESVWTGDVLVEEAEFSDWITAGGIAAAACAVTALVLLILILVFTGRDSRDEAGNIALNWYDRIWSEIHVASATGFAVGFVALVILLYELWPAQEWPGLFLSDYADAQYYGIPNKLAAAFLVLAMTGSAVFCLTSLVSLVKKLKAGSSGKLPSSAEFCYLCGAVSAAVTGRE